MASRASRPAKHNFYNGVYFGTLKSGKCHGKGVFFWDSGEFYFGEWEQNKMHGEGIFFFAYGGVIKGQFYKSKINGAAILKFPNGDVYEGFWRHGKLDGKCFKYFLHDKTWALCIYENGMYRSCLNRGKGTPNINFEEKLTDNIEIDTSINAGVHISTVPFMDGGKYYGSIQEDNADGLGFTSHPTGAYDAGFYENGVIDGLGRISFPGGNFYDGEMKEGQFEGEGFFYKKDTNRWIFGNFQQGQCVSVLEKGSGVPFEEICAWKGRKRRGNSQPFYILNNMFFVPVIGDSNNKKGKKKTQRFVGLKRAPSVTNDSQFITDINQVLQSTPDPNMGTLDSRYESQGSPASRLLLPTSPTAQQNFNTGEMSNKSEANDAKALAARVQDNIEKNWDFFTTSAAQQQATEEPVSKGSPQPGARKLNQAQMQQQQRQFGRSSTYQEPEAPKMLSTQKSAGSLLKGKTVNLERQKTGPVESIYTAALKTTKVKDSSASGQSTGKSAGKSPLNQDFSGQGEQQGEKKPARKSGSSTGSLGILRDKKGLSPQNKTQNRISSREFLNNAGVNEDTLELDFRNDYNTHSLEDAGGFGETPPGETGHPGQGGKSPAFQYWQRSETPNEEDQLFGPSKSYGQTLNKEDQIHGRFGSISSVNSHQPNKPHLFEGARESSLIDLGIGGGRRSTGEEEDVKEQEEGGKKKLTLRTGDEEDDEEEENSAIEEIREEEEFTPKASTKRSLKFGNKGLSSVGERSLSQETSPSVKSKRLLVDKRRTEESEDRKQEGGPGTGTGTGGLSHRKWLDDFEGQHEELEKSGKIDSSFNSPEKSVSSPEKILRSARSVERILDLQRTPGHGITEEDGIDSRREGREGNKSDLFGQGKEIVSPLIKREMETEEDDDMIIKRIEENLVLIGKEKKSPVPPLVGPGEDEFREHLHKRMKSGQQQQKAGEKEKTEEGEKEKTEEGEESDNLQEKAQNEGGKQRSLGHLDEDNSGKIVTFGRIIVPSDREFALENEKKGQGEGGDSSLNKSRVSKASKASKDVSQEGIKENKEAEDEEEVDENNQDIINEATEEVLLSSQRRREEEEKEVKSKLIVKGESGVDAKDEFTGGLNTLQALEQRQREYEEEASKGALPTSLEGLEGKEELEMDDIGAVKDTEEEGIQKIKETEEDYHESIDRDVTIERMTEAERRRLMLSGDFTADGNRTLERLGDEDAGDMEKILSNNMLKGSQGGSQAEVKSKGDIGGGVQQEFPGVKKNMTYEFDDSEENRENREAKEKEENEVKEGKTPRKGRKSKVLENGEVVDADSDDSFRTANSPDNTEDKLNELEGEGEQHGEDYIVESFSQNQEEEEQENIKRAGQRQTSSTGTGAGFIMIQDQNAEENGSSSQQERERSVRKTFVDRAVGNDTEPNEEVTEEEAYPVMQNKDIQSPELTARDLQEIRVKSYADVNVQFPEFSPEEHPAILASQPVQQHGHRNPGQEIAVDYSILENNSQRKKSKYELDLQHGFAESYENPNNSRPHSLLASPYREEAGSPFNQKAATTTKKEGEVDGQIRSPPIYIVSHVVSRYGSAPGSQDEIVDKISKTLSHEIDQIFNESLSASMKRLASIEPSSLPNSHRQRLPSSSKDLEPQIIIVSPDRIREQETEEEHIARSAKPERSSIENQEGEEHHHEEEITAEKTVPEVIPQEEIPEASQENDYSQEVPKQQNLLTEDERNQSFHQDEASRHLSHDESQSQRQGRFINTAKSPQRGTVESGFSSPIQSSQNTPLKNNSNLTISPGRFASPLRMAGSPTNLDYGIPNQKTDPLQARPPRSRKSASKNDVPVSVNGQPSLSSPLRQMDLFPRTPELNPENEFSAPLVSSVDIIKEEETPVKAENKFQETPLVSVSSELDTQNVPISTFPGAMKSSNENVLLTVPLHHASPDSSLYPNQSELDPTPTFTTTSQLQGDRPNRFSRNSPEAAPNDEELMKRSESPVPTNILRQEYEAKTPEPKASGADDLNSSNSMIYKTPENEIRRIPENDEDIEDENFFTPVDSHRKRYMYPNTPLAKIEEGDEEGSMLNTASKLQQDTANSLVYSPFSTRRSPIRSSPGRYNSARQTILSMNNFKNSGKKYYNAPETMKPDVRNAEDVLEPIGVGAKKFAKTTPKKFDNKYLTTSPNKKGYNLGSPH